MAPSAKDPSGLLDQFRHQMNEIFNYLSALDRPEGSREHDFVPPVEIYETAAAFVVEIELPGLSDKDMTLSIADRLLLVSGHKREERESRRMNYLCLERSFGRFSRSVEIPPGFDEAGVKATYERGVLSVSFPRMGQQGVVIRDVPIIQGD
jgi:HSP20 family protein